MAKGGSKSEAKKDSGHGYWMYKDGVSIWGIGTYRGDECPIQTTEALHKGTTEDKVKWYNDTQAALVATQQAKDAEEKADKASKKK